MSYQQLEFEVLAELAANGELEGSGAAAGLPSFCRRAKKKAASPASVLGHSVAISSALRAENLSHAFYDVLACVAVLQAEATEDGSAGFASIARMMWRLGTAHQNIRLHLHRNPDFFEIDRNFPTLRIRLSQTALELLARVLKGAKAAAANPPAGH